MKTVEEILAAMQNIIDGADGRSLSDDEVTKYENLETELTKARKDAEIRARQNAYQTPVNVGVHVGIPKSDNGLDLAFENYLRTGRPNQDIAQLRVNEGPYNAQSAGTDAAGGYMVPPGFRQKLVEVRKAFGGFAAAAEEYNTETGNTVEFPSLDDTANQGQITAENAAVSGGADMTFGTVTLGAYKYTASGASNAPLKVSLELLQDSAFDVAGLVARVFGTRIARKQATDFVTGAGTTLPFGVIHNGLTADSTITGATISYDQLLDLETLLDQEYEQNAQFLMNKATWLILRKLKDTAGRPLILENAESGMAQGVARFLLGYPVIIDQAVPSNAINTKFMALGDFREGYVIRRVQNLVVLVNPYSSAASGQVEYVGWERADGNIQNRKAYVILARGGT